MDYSGEEPCVVKAGCATKIDAHYFGIEPWRYSPHTINAVKHVKNSANTRKYPNSIHYNLHIEYVPCEFVQQNKFKLVVDDFGGYESGHPGERIEIAKEDIVQMHMKRGKIQLARDIKKIANNERITKQKRLEEIQKLLDEFDSC
jgi:hypothetical protein